MNKQTLYDGETFEHKGYHFKVEFPHDEDADRPWENSDGHGPVREAEWDRDYGRPRKAPGERILNNSPCSRETIWAYDWAKACKLAKKDGWNAPPYDAPGRVQRAVQADFDFLAGWVNDQWSYCGVVVKLLDEELDEDGDGTGDYEEVTDAPHNVEDALWCVEDNGDYRSEVAFQCADNIIYSIEQAISDDLMAEMAAAREVLEARYWASRDVETV